MLKEYQKGQPWNADEVNKIIRAINQQGRFTTTGNFDSFYNQSGSHIRSNKQDGFFARITSTATVLASDAQPPSLPSGTTLEQGGFLNCGNYLIAQTYNTALGETVASPANTIAVFLPPSPPSLSASNTPSSLPAGLYTFGLTYVDGSTTFETGLAANANITITAFQSINVASPQPSPNMTAYNVYFSGNGGGTYTLVATVPIGTAYTVSAVNQTTINPPVPATSVIDVASPSPTAEATTYNTYCCPVGGVLRQVASQVPIGTDTFITSLGAGLGIGVPTNIPTEEGSYSWTMAYFDSSQGEAIQWSGLSGAPGSMPAYEQSGSGTVALNSLVKMEISADGQSVYFDAPVQMTTTASQYDTSQFQPKLTQLDIDQLSGLKMAVSPTQAGYAQLGLQACNSIHPGGINGGDQQLVNGTKIVSALALAPYTLNNRYPSQFGWNIWQNNDRVFHITQVASLFPYIVGFDFVFQSDGLFQANSVHAFQGINADTMNATHDIESSFGSVRSHLSFYAGGVAGVNAVSPGKIAVYSPTGGGTPTNPTIQYIEVRGGIITGVSQTA